MKNRIRNITMMIIIFEFFHGLSGLAGGIGLISDPTAESLGMDIGWLAGTPFSNYLIPGIVLLVVNGIGNTVAAIISITRKIRIAEMAMFFGFVMMVWIFSQVAWIGYKSFLQPLYFSTGMLQFILGVFLFRFEKAGS